MCKRPLHALLPAALAAAFLLTALVGCGSSADGDTAGPTPSDANAADPNAPAGDATDANAPVADANDAPPLPPLAKKATTPFDELDPNIGTLTNKKQRELPAPAKRVMKQAEQALDTGNTPRAINRLERVKGFDRQNVEVLKKLAAAYTRLPNWGKAIDNYEAAAEVAPNDIALQVTLGDLHRKQDHPGKALLAYRHALATSAAEPNNPLAAHALHQAAHLLDQQGRWQAALDAYTTLERWLVEHGTVHAGRDDLRELVTHPETLLKKRGRLLLRLRKPGRAAELLARAHRRDRDDADTVVALLRALRADEQFDQAEDVLVNLLSERTLRTYVLPLARKTAVASGDKDMPLRLWRASSKKRFDRQIGLALAGAAERMGNLADAATILQAIVEADPTSTSAGRQLAELHLRRRKPAAALKLLGTVYTAAPAEADNLTGVLRDVAETLSFREARQIAQAALSDESASAGRRYAAARLASVKGADELARKLYRATLGVDADFSPAYAALAEDALAGGDDDRLRQLDARLKEVAEKAPSAMVLTVRARIQLARRQPASALDTLAKARKLDDSYVPAAILLADILERRDEATRARRALLETLVKAPRDRRIYQALFESYFNDRRFAEAEAIASRATQRLDPPAEGKILQARLALAKGDFDSFDPLLAELRLALNKDIRVRTLALQGKLARRTGMLSKNRFQTLEKQLADLVQDHPRYQPARKLLAQLYGEVAQYEPATKHWETLFRQTFARRNTAMAYAAALMRAERYDRAAQALQAARTFDDEDLLLRRMLLDVWERGQAYATGAKHAEKWYNQEKDAHDASALRNWYFWRLMELLRLGEKYDKALAVIDDRLESDEAADEETLRSQRLRVHAAGENYKKLAAEATSWVEELTTQAEDADNPDRKAQLLERRRYVQRLAAALLMDKKQYDRAQKLLETWIGDRSGPGVEHLRSLRILAWGEADDLKKARQYALAWVKESPAALAPRQALVAALEDRKKYADAAELLDTWVKSIKVPTDLATPSRGEAQTLEWCRQTHVIALVSADKPKDALAQANTYLKKHPRDPLLLRYKAVALGELGRTKEQIAALEQIYGMDRQDPGINNDLGYTYADAGVKLDKAERMIRTALRARPATIAFRDSLGWALYKQGKFAAAGEQFRVILDDEAFADANDPTEAHPVIFEHAGDVMYRLGWTERARKLWSDAARLGMKIKDRSSEVREVIIRAEAKLVALKEGREPEPAPLGEGVKPPSQNGASPVE